MTKEELLKALAEARKEYPEDAHQEADDLLLEYINDKDITDAFKSIPRYYS